MSTLGILIARCVAGLVTIASGSLFQIVMWKRSAKTYFDALTEHSWLWILYLLIGLLIGEHAIRWISKRK